MLTLLIESALRSLVLGAVVGAFLWVLRVHNPHIKGFAWKGVLAATLLMPMVMQWTAMTVPMPIAGVSWPVIEVTAGAGPSTESISWTTVALAIYLIIAGGLLLKYLMNLVASWRCARNAQRYSDACTQDLDVRVSSSVRTPATFGSVILVPEDFVNWDESRQQAVLLHEQAHVRNKDFHIQVAAELHRIVFWFSPLAWWLPKQLSIVAEDISDDAAIAALSDRPLYADTLLQMACRHRDDMPATALAMARPATVAPRIERILSEHCCPTALRITQKIGICAMLLPIVAIASGTSPGGTETSPRAESPPAIEPPPPPAESTAPTPPRLNTGPRVESQGLTKPPFPPESRAAGEQGVVTLLLLIGDDGAVRDVQVENSTGYPRLDLAASTHAYTWHFRPALRDGKPTTVWHAFKVKFSPDSYP